jgi:DNA-binding NarL/FixJ family response regulator
MNTSSGFGAVLSEAAVPGMNGYELVRQLAVRHSSTEVIFVTATHVQCEVCSYAAPVDRKTACSERIG